MNIYNNNSKNYSSDFDVRKDILDLLGGDSSKCSSIYEVDCQILKIYQEGGGEIPEGGGSVTIPLNPITITRNGVYTPEEGTGYGEITVEIPEIPLNTITITENGTYTPEEGGYSEVVVDVKGSGGEIQKIKVSSITISNDCIEDGRWKGETVLDTSTLTSIAGLFYNCSLLTQLDVSAWNTSNIKDMSQVFYGCSSLKQLNISGWNAENVTLINYMSYKSNNIVSYVGGRTIDEVISNNIGILNGLKVSGSYIFGNNANRASLRALINGVADLTGQTAKTLSFITTLKGKLTEEDIAVATAKNWTIS